MTDKLNNYVEGIYFNIKETRKRVFLVIVAKKKKILHQKQEKEISTLKNKSFEKKDPKVKSLDYLNT